LTSSQFIGQKLNASTDVTDIAGTRIYFGVIPEEQETLPAINYLYISAPNLWGQTERERFQISCRAENPETAKELAFQVRRTFNNFQGTVGTFDVQNCWYEEQQMIIEDNEAYHIPVDIFVLYYRTT